MKNWKRYALAAACAALVVVLAAVLWQMDSPAPQGSPAATTQTTSSPAPAVSPSPTASQTAPLPSPVPSETAPSSSAATPAPSAPPAATPEVETGCTITIRCDTVLKNLDALDPDKTELIPDNGVLLEKTDIDFSDAESAFDLLKRVCQDKGIHLEFSITPGYGSTYIEGIGNLYEFDCGERSGWLYRVNGEVPNVACSSYTLQAGDAVEFLYSCDWGQDLD